MMFRFLSRLCVLLSVLLILRVGASAASRICFEAESGTLTDPVKVEDESAASGGKCLVIIEGVGKPPDVQGDAAFTLSVPEDGAYVVWARCLWMDGCGNSIRLSVDGGDPVILGEDGTYKRWHWVMLRGVTWKLTKGDHPMRMLNNEDGVKVDQFLLLTDRLYVPVAVEKVDGAPSQPAGGPAPAPKP